MEDYLKRLYGALPSWARVLSDPIVSRLMAVYNWIFGLMRATIPNWRTIVNGAKAFRAGAGLLGFETFATLRYFRDIFVPRLANAARDAAIRALTTLLNKTVAPIVRDILALRKWSLEQIAAAVKAIQLLRDMTINGLAALTRRLLTLERRVFTEWGTADKLALWLVGAMWKALWRYGWGQVDKIADYFWRRRQAILLRTVAEAERLLGRLL